MILLFCAGIVLLRVFYLIGEMAYEKDWPRSTWRGLCMAIVLLLLCASAFAQTVRVDIPIQTYGPTVPTSSGPLPQTLWVANATVNLCTHPSGTLAACQAAPLTTYTDSTGGTTCATATPLVQLPGSTCTASTGAASNIGFWYGGGSFDYWITTSYGSFGPFSGTGSSSTPGCFSSPLGVTCGGTGATTAAGAALNLKSSQRSQCNELRCEVRRHHRGHNGNSGGFYCGRGRWNRAHSHQFYLYYRPTYDAWILHA